MNERRKGDRRRYDHRPNFPLVDSDGNLITKNRRRVVERRFKRATEADAAVLGQDGDNEASSGGEGTRACRLLLVLDDREITLDDTARDFVIGRHSESDWRADSKTVSRHHLRLSWEGGAFVVTDQSSNGTYVRDSDGETHHLQGDSLALVGSGMMYLGLPPEDPGAVEVAYTVS